MIQMTCNRPEYKKFCTKAYKYIPSCEKVDKGDTHPSSFFWESLEETGILIQLFELKEILMQKKMVKFSSKGICMYPCIQPGDILHIERKNAEQIKIGDIAVYRRYNRLFAHRTIDKGDNKGLNYIITRPDTARYGNDGSSFDDDIVGIVSAVKRKGRLLTVEKKPHSLTKELYLKLFFVLLNLRRILMINFIYILAFLQQFAVCRRILKLFLKTNKGLNFSISAPLSNNINSMFNRVVSPEELIDLNHKADEDKILKWKITLNIGSKAAAFLSFVLKPKNCFFSGWWISEAKIMPIYWGSGMEEKIFQRADELLGLLGASLVSVGIFKKDYLSRMFFKRLGFEENLTYKNKLLGQDYDSLGARIILERKI